MQDRQPPGSAIAPPAPPVSAAAIPDYLVFSILITLFCCLPPGIVGIVFASKANSLKARGDFAGAMAASNTAKLWCWIGVGVGVVVNILLFVFAGRMLSGIASFSGAM